MKESQIVSTNQSRRVDGYKGGKMALDGLRLVAPTAALLGACAPMSAAGAEALAGVQAPQFTPDGQAGAPVLPTPTPKPAEVAMATEANAESAPLPITEVMVKNYAQIMGFNPAEVVARLSNTEPFDLGFATGVRAIIDPETGAIVVLSRTSGEKVNYFEATMRSLFTGANKLFGSHLNGVDDKQDGVYTSAKAHQLALATAGQIRQENLDKGSISAAERLIKNSPGTVMLHNAFEPDKLPIQASENLDGWIDGRLDQLLTLAQSAKGPVVLVLGNEIFTDYGGSQWNGQDGPLFAKYGENWPVEVYMRMMEKMDKKGLVLGTKIIPVFNEAHIMNGGEHAQYVSTQYKTLEASIRARYEAEGKTAPDYLFDLAMEGHFSEVPDGNSFVAIPTNEDIDAALDLFEGVGGGKILFDEVGVRESGDARIDALARLSAKALIDPRVRGIFLWSTFDNSPNQNDPFDYGTNGLFDPSAAWKPTCDYYSLMAGIATNLAK